MELSVQAAVSRLRLQDEPSVFPRGPITPPRFGLVPEVAEGHLSPLQLDIESAVGLVEATGEVEDIPRLQILCAVAEAVEELGRHDVFARGTILAHLDRATVPRPVLGFLVRECLMQGTPEG